MRPPSWAWTAWTNSPSKRRSCSTGTNKPRSSWWSTRPTAPAGIHSQCSRVPAKKNRGRATPLDRSAVAAPEGPPTGRKPGRRRARPRSTWATPTTAWPITATSTGPPSRACGRCGSAVTNASPRSPSRRTSTRTGSASTRPCSTRPCTRPSWNSWTGRCTCRTRGTASPHTLAASPKSGSGCPPPHPVPPR